MKRIKVAYPKILNMGDLLNEVIIKNLFGIEIVSAFSLNADLSAIGSGLGRFTYNKNQSFISKVKRFLFYVIRPTLYVWGTGFISYDNSQTGFCKRMKIKALRGNLSKSRAEKLLKKKLDIVVGDPGLLSSLLLNEIPSKRYKIGIIPHFREKNEKIFKELADYYPNSLLINVMQDPISVIEQISQCEVILSSSLHGLIISDSLHIPNYHIKVTDKLLGDGFKFDDYYSAFNIEHKFLNLKNDSFPSIEWIKNNYKIEPEIVDKIKNDLLESFPFYSFNKYKCS